MHRQQNQLFLKNIQQRMLAVQRAYFLKIRTVYTIAGREYKKIKTKKASISLIKI